MDYSISSYRSVRVALPLLLVSVLLFGCDDDDDDTTPAQQRYEIALINATNNQPLSPVAVVLHQEGYQGWEIGSAASVGLERLAEGGDPSAFLDEANAAAAVVATVAGEAAIAPGATGTVTLSISPSDNLELTLATMLVNSNDAFAGATGHSIKLAVGEQISLWLPSYDAGTEANDEAAATIPGPAGGGEGFNAEREAADRVSRHPGVVTAADGLASSALDGSHRWDNPVAKVVVRRSR